jgi:glycosyltransferase involved in cell wall biosynthesis
VTLPADSLVIVVPVFNEEANVDDFWARVARLGLSDALVFVDNGSTDATVPRLERHGARIVRHATNEGYGASIRDGIMAADAERIVIIDADLEYPPEAIPEIVATLERHAAVYGSRFLGRKRPAMPLARRLGNRLITGTYNVLFGQHTTDLYTGLKGLRRSAFPLGDLRRDGFEHVVELGVMIALAGERIHDLPVEYAPRSRGISKMRHLPETLKFVACVFGYWFRCVVLGRPLGAGGAR